MSIELTMALTAGLSFILGVLLSAKQVYRLARLHLDKKYRKELFAYNERLISLSNDLILLMSNAEESEKRSNAEIDRLNEENLKLRTENAAN